MLGSCWLCVLFLLSFIIFSFRLGIFTIYFSSIFFAFAFLSRRLYKFFAAFFSCEAFFNIYVYKSIISFYATLSVLSAFNFCFAHIAKVSQIILRQWNAEQKSTLRVRHDTVRKSKQGRNKRTIFALIIYKRIHFECVYSVVHGILVGSRHFVDTVYENCVDGSSIYQRRFVVVRWSLALVVLFERISVLFESGSVLVDYYYITSVVPARCVLVHVLNNNSIWRKNKTFTRVSSCVSLAVIKSLSHIFRVKCMWEVRQRPQGRER